MWNYFIFGIAVLALIGFLMRDTSQPVRGSAEIDISAPINKVWALQTDLARWKEWNADIEEMNVKGPLEAGTEFTWKAGGITINSRITEVIEHRRIVWTGKTMGIDAVHKWEFSSGGEVTHVSTEEEFSGFLPWLLPGTMRKTILNALQHGVHVLKVASEKQAGP